jgi:hypothetical protein
MTLSNDTPSSVEILILGAGWTSTFLIPYLDTQGITHAATTRSGREGTIAFSFDEASSTAATFESLPRAKTVLITFPTTGISRLVELYNRTHDPTTQYILLGSSGIWNAPTLVTRHSPWDPNNARARAEEELLLLGGCVLNLSGLWGGSRNPHTWVARVAPTKEKLAAKGSLHVVHGEDVAVAVVAVHQHWQEARGQRWVLTDLRCYDWWDLALAWGGEECRAWALELIGGEGTLPRDRQKRGRAIDSSEFWRVFGVLPKRCLYYTPT